MFGEDVRSRSRHEVAQYESGEDEVVGKADDGHEVGHEVNRRQQVDDEEPQKEPSRTGNATIGGQPSDQAGGVGEESQRATKCSGLGATQEEHEREDEPGNGKADDQSEDPRHGFILTQVGSIR